MRACTPTIVNLSCTCSDYNGYGTLVASHRQRHSLQSSVEPCVFIGFEAQAAAETIVARFPNSRSTVNGRQLATFKATSHPSLDENHSYEELGYTIRPVKSNFLIGANRMQPLSPNLGLSGHDMEAGASSSLSPNLSSHTASPRTPMQEGGFFRRRLASSSAKLGGGQSGLFSNPSPFAVPKDAPQSDPQAEPVRQARRRSSFFSTGTKTNIAQGEDNSLKVSLVKGARRLRERSVPNLSFLFNKDAKQDPASYPHERAPGPQSSGVADLTSHSSSLGMRLLAPFQIDQRKAGSDPEAKQMTTDDVISKMERSSSLDEDPFHDAPIRVIKAGNIILESLPSERSLPEGPARTQHPMISSTSRASHRPISSVPSIHIEQQQQTPLQSMPSRPDSFVPFTESSRTPVAPMHGHLTNGFTSASSGLTVDAVNGKTFQDPSPMPAGDSSNVLLSTFSVSNALSDLAASLRWSSKFPEGAHMTRARSGALSRRLSAFSTMDEKKDGSSMFDEGDLGRVNQLGYLDPHPRHDSVNRRGKKEQKDNQKLFPDAETREGLRFLAKARHEVESEDASSLLDYGDRDALADAIFPTQFSNATTFRKAKWNSFKIVLFVSILTVSILCSRQTESLHD